MEYSSLSFAELTPYLPNLVPMLKWDREGEEKKKTNGLHDQFILKQIILANADQCGRGETS